jgi:hypothetical protein
MPKVFERDGYRFFFYSNEHRSMHVHVRYGGGEAVFEVEPRVELRESQGLKVRELAKAEELASEHQALSLRSGMSILTDSARSAVFRDGPIIIVMKSGTEIRFPVAENPRLAKGTPEQLSRIELSPFGVHWPDLDEDLSLQGLLRGDHGQHQKVEPEGGANRQ